MAAAMGARLVLFHFPTALLKLAGNLLGKRSEIDKLLGSLCVDSSLVRTQLGVQAVSTLAEISRNAAGPVCQDKSEFVIPLSLKRLIGRGRVLKSQRYL